MGHHAHRRWLRVGTSSTVAVLGFHWFVERAGWLG
jgi:hypothetical protein